MHTCRPQDIAGYYAPDQKSDRYKQVAKNAKNERDDIQKAADASLKQPLGIAKEGFDSQVRIDARYNFGCGGHFVPWISISTFLQSKALERHMQCEPSLALRQLGQMHSGELQPGGQSC